METSIKTNEESKGFYKLSWLQRIGFGSGDLAQNLIYQTVCMYLLIFYTNVYGLEPSAAAFMFLIVRVVDVLWDPLVGAFVDKHNPKLGKYRSYLILAGIPLTGFAILCFWNGFSGSLVYAYFTYVGLSMLYTLINVPYGALNASLTRDTDEITTLTSVRMFLANTGGLAVAYGIPKLVASLSPDGMTNTAKAPMPGFIPWRFMRLPDCFYWCSVLHNAKNVSLWMPKKLKKYRYQTSGWSSSATDPCVFLRSSSLQHLP